MTSLLSLANGALRLLKDSRPLTQAEYTNGTRPVGRAIKAAIDGGAITYCLEEGLWKFATRSVMLDSAPSVDDETEGYTYVFTKPDDYIRTAGIYRAGAMNPNDALTDYRDEAGYWFANIDPIYVAYISDDNAYGMDFSLWPQSFVKFVEAHLATEAAGPLAGEYKDLVRVRKTLLGEALGKDAMSMPTRMLPTGNWNRARQGGGTRENWRR